MMGWFLLGSRRHATCLIQPLLILLSISLFSVRLAGVEQPTLFDMAQIGGQYNARIVRSQLADGQVHVTVFEAQRDDSDEQADAGDTVAGDDLWNDSMLIALEDERGVFFGQRLHGQPLGDRIAYEFMIRCDQMLRAELIDSRKDGGPGLATESMGEWRVWVMETVDERTRISEVLTVKELSERVGSLQAGGQSSGSADGR